MCVCRAVQRVLCLWSQGDLLDGQRGVAVTLENTVVGLKHVTCKKWVCLKFAWLPFQTSFMVSPGNESTMRLWSLSIRVTLWSSSRLSVKVQGAERCHLSLEQCKGTGTLARREFCQ